MKFLVIILTFLFAIIPFGVVGQKVGDESIAVSDATHFALSILLFWFFSLFIGYWIGRDSALKTWHNERKEKNQTFDVL